MRKVWPLLLLAASAACLEEPAFRCRTDGQCVSKGYPGICDLPSATCAYPSADCRGINSIEGFVDGQGRCVPAPNGTTGPSSTSTTGDSTGTSDPVTTAPGTTDPTDDSTSSGEPTPAESSSSGADESSTGDDTSTSGPGCGGQLQDLTEQGTVTATSTFNENFEKELSIDGRLDTSWFSSGPEGGGGPSVYGWSTVTDRCIARIEVDDNSQHSQPQFRTGFGFETATVRVLQNDSVLFERTIALPGTPDGPIAVDTGGVEGSRVLLELGGHEDSTCGGFSELRVLGGAV